MKGEGLEVGEGMTNQKNLLSQALGQGGLKISRHRDLLQLAYYSSSPSPVFIF